MEKEIKEMIEQNKVRFILRKEEVEITAPEDVDEKIESENQ